MNALDVGWIRLLMQGLTWNIPSTVKVIPVLPAANTYLTKVRNKQMYVCHRKEEEQSNLEIADSGDQSFSVGVTAGREA